MSRYERASLMFVFPACVVSYFVGSLEVLWPSLQRCLDQASDDTALVVWIGPARTKTLKCKTSLMPMHYPSS